ncbi:hypothetical protein BATDEDRAFT_13604, partial [Batrachochytrium dendrobatidis JAM81]
ERYYGFENFGNTCYCNSVLQVLYFCKPFRNCVVCYNFPESAENAQNSILHAMQELFVAISTQKKRTGVFSPRYFISKLKEENELFNNTMQQDAHEMFNYLLNAIAEILLNQKTEMHANIQYVYLFTLVKEQTAPTWIHALFEGQLTNETKCLNCESITNRVESFLDLSIDIDQHSSISSCLRNFSSSEVLYGKNKFFCDTCNSLQEAEKRMKIKRLPNVLAVHLKRFKFQEQLGRYSKLSYQVSFPLELRLFNTADGAENADRLYQLHGVVVHIGSSPQSGHYVALIKSENQWMLFDDDDVRVRSMMCCIWPC